MSSQYTDSGGNTDYSVQEMRWGLIPSFVPNHVELASKSSHNFATANARSDTLAQRPAYRSSIQHGWRCVIVCQG